MNPTEQPVWLRLMAGALLTLAAIVAFGWVLSFAWIRFEFQKMPPLRDNEQDLSVLTGESIQLAALLRRDPFNGVIRKRLATVQARLGLYEQALADLERAVQTNNTPDVFYFRADMFEKLGNLPRAQEEMRKAITLNPANPQYNAAYLRLLGLDLDRIKAAETEAKSVNPFAAQKLEVQKLIAEASRNWYVRAPRDKNSYLFLANHYVGPPLYALQSYRLFLMGLSQAPYMDLNRDFMISPRDALNTVDDILPVWAPAYHNLPFGNATGPDRRR